MRTKHKQSVAIFVFLEQLFNKPLIFIELSARQVVRKMPNTAVGGWISSRRGNVVNKSMPRRGCMFRKSSTLEP
jgi:hypothetical protein